MTIALRAHHLLCALTYVGQGYSAAFVENYDAIVARMNAGEHIRVVAGPDDICAPLCNTGGAHCHEPSVTERDRLAVAALAPLIDSPLQPGSQFKLTSEVIARLRASFARGQTRQACDGCEWTDLCTRVASDGYAGVRLRASTQMKSAKLS